MDDGRLFIGGQLRHHGLTMPKTVPTIPGVLMPPDTTFISHHSNDKLAAEQVALMLSRQGYPCYLDTFDPNVDGDSPDLERYLRWIIGLCTNLMAMVSLTTKTSW